MVHVRVRGRNPCPRLPCPHADLGGAAARAGEGQRWNQPEMAWPCAVPSPGDGPSAWRGPGCDLRPGLTDRGLRGGAPPRRRVTATLDLDPQSQRKLRVTQPLQRLGASRARDLRPGQRPPNCPPQTRRGVADAAVVGRLGLSGRPSVQRLTRRATPTTGCVTGGAVTAVGVHGGRPRQPPGRHGHARAARLHHEARQPQPRHADRHVLRRRPPEGTPRCPPQRHCVRASQPPREVCEDDGAKRRPVQAAIPPRPAFHPAARCLTRRTQPVSGPMPAPVTCGRECELLSPTPTLGGHQRLCQRPRSPVPRGPALPSLSELSIHLLYPADSFLQDERQEPPPPPGSPPSTRPATPGCSRAPWPPRPFKVICVCPSVLARPGTSRGGVTTVQCQLLGTGTLSGRKALRTKRPPPPRTGRQPSPR